MTDSLVRSPAHSRPPTGPGLSADNRPDPKTIQGVQLVRKAVLLFAIVALVAIAMATGPGLPGEAAHAVILGAGLVALTVAIIGRAWCSLYIGGRKKAEIVDRGPYSVTRNPLYVFSFFGAFGMGAQTGSLTLATAFVAVAFVVFAATVKREEAWLQRAFGERYDRYREETPRFLPRWSSWRDEAELIIAPKYFLTTLRDGSVMLLSAPLFWAIAGFHASNVLPTVFTLV